MASEEVNNYITKRYSKWLDYSSYQCTRAGIPNESLDVLNEALMSILQKPPELLSELLESKKNGHTALDYFILAIIKRNATSPTSEYQNRYSPIPVDENVDYNQLEIEAQPNNQEEQEDINDIMLDKFHRVREAFDSLGLSPLASRVFEFHFFQDESFLDWPGPESKKLLYEIYNGVRDLIRRKIFGESIF